MAYGLSTRPVEVRGAGYAEAFTKEALLGVIKQVRAGYVRLNDEHLSCFPPRGHWHRAEIEDDEDGHSRLIMYGHYLSRGRTADRVLSSEPVEATPGPSRIAEIDVRVEPRNFDSDVWTALVDESPLPTHEYAARSLLPPLIWTISVPVVWGLAQFSGGFLKRLGEAAGDRVAEWIGSYSRRSRDNYRDSLVEIQFEVAKNLTVSAFIPFSPVAHTAVAELREGLDGLGPVASVAGGMVEDGDPVDVRLVAFFYHDGKWKLGWWATEEDACVTEWFDTNHPDPAKLIGRPRLAIQQDDAGRSLPLSLFQDAEPSEEGGGNGIGNGGRWRGCGPTDRRESWEAQGRSTDDRPGSG